MVCNLLLHVYFKHPMRVARLYSLAGGCIDGHIRELILRACLAPSQDELHPLANHRHRACCKPSLMQMPANS